MIVSLVMFILVGIGGPTFASDSSGFGYELILGEFDQLRQHLFDIGNKTQQTLPIKAVKVALGMHEIQSCQDTLNTTSGVFQIYPEQSTIPSMFVYCDHTVEKGGWIVVHRRFDGKLNFNRNWTEYREGFGNLQGEYWLGLEKMHLITRSANYELLVVMKSFNGTTKSARFGRFMVASEFENYKLILGKFMRGDARDSFFDHDGLMFSTMDRDNDRDTGSCARSYKSGWWFSACYTVNLNGEYEEDNDSSMSWFRFFNNHNCLKEARMLIRRI
ncbi:angiopoietin-related protein 2-like [Sabethes cyaneus]|uniref:angiopoietin-related protein 2-like n=1 Tax=Sabethes cyaneus TaxID=53552 RepID=UPI00237DF081|nr:angiopoietin-related protein 2-like [Sabethes cyaneus]